MPVRSVVGILSLVVVSVACSAHPRSVLPFPEPDARSATTDSAVITSATADSASIARAKADSVRYPYTVADVRFMTGMIAHHSQAILMSSWAPTHGASASVRRLAERIVNGQEDEILSMRQWLQDRRQPAGNARAETMKMMVNGAHHEMLMSGMLSDAQLAQLVQANGTTFDRLFLTFMIQHHRGALAMVEGLLSTEGALQDQTVFKLASDINADQSTEVERMERMLSALSSPAPSR